MAASDLENPDLLRLSEASSRINQVCRDIIKERRAVFELPKIEEIEQLINKLINTSNSILFKKTDPNYKIYAAISDWSDNKLRISQLIKGINENLETYRKEIEVTINNYDTNFEGKEINEIVTNPLSVTFSFSCSKYTPSICSMTCRCLISSPFQSLASQSTE